MNVVHEIRTRVGFHISLFDFPENCLVCINFDCSLCHFFFYARISSRPFRADRKGYPSAQAMERQKGTGTGTGVVVDAGRTRSECCESEARLDILGPRLRSLDLRSCGEYTNTQGRAARPRVGSLAGNAEKQEHLAVGRHVGEKDALFLRCLRVAPGRTEKERAWSACLARAPLRGEVVPGLEGGGGWEPAWLTLKWRVAGVRDWRRGLSSGLDSSSPVQDIHGS